jgi:magnesium transporter
MSDRNGLDRASMVVEVVGQMDVRLITDGVVTDHPMEGLAELLRRDDGLVWVDIPECDPVATQALAEVFGFHPHAIRDAAERNRVPKLHAYADHVFVVLHAPEPGRQGHVHYIELDQFICRRYLVTVHGPINPAVDPAVALRETSAVLARIRAGRLKPDTGFELSYAIVSALTRQQEEFVETVTKDVWRINYQIEDKRSLEQQVTGGELGDPEELVNELFQARHGLLTVRTMAALSAAICGRMATLERVSPDGRRLVADLADQFDRVRSVAEGEKEYLQGVIDFYQTVLKLRSTLATQAQNEEVRQLTQASYAQNEEIRKISAWAAILFAPTLVGTIYGMNFEHMPELNWIFGYPAALILMLLTSVVLYTVFKRRYWL